MGAAEAIRVGDIDVIPLVDGWCRLPPAFYQGVDVATHGLVAEDGFVHLPIGCFAVRSGDRVVLVDAGLGTVDSEWADGGRVAEELRAAGIDPAQVDTVVCTHLHVDHAAGVVDAEHRPVFPNATVRFGPGDWEQFVAGAGDGDPTRTAMEALAALDRLAPLDGDEVPVAPGVTARATPGHTLGHYGFVVGDGDDRLVLLGDAVECPLQLTEPDLFVLSDVDPALARRTREAMWQELEGTGARIGAAHFPDLRFGRVLAGEGKRWFA